MHWLYAGRCFKIILHESEYECEFDIYTNDNVLERSIYIYLYDLLHVLHLWLTIITSMLSGAKCFRLIDWCLTPTLAVFQQYCGMNKFDINIRLIFFLIQLIIKLGVD